MKASDFKALPAQKKSIITGNLQHHPFNGSRRSLLLFPGSQRHVITAVILGEKTGNSFRGGKKGVGYNNVSRIPYRRPRAQLFQQSGKHCPESAGTFQFPGNPVKNAGVPISGIQHSESTVISFKKVPESAVIAISDQPFSIVRKIGR